MTIEEIKKTLESTTCREHKKHPIVIVSHGNIQKIRACCQQFLLELKTQADSLLDQMDEEQFRDVTGTINLTVEQYKRAVGNLLHLRELIQKAQKEIKDVTVAPTPIYKFDIDLAKHSYERVIRSNKATEKFIEEGKKIIAEAEKLKPLISKARQAHDKHLRQIQREKEKAKNAKKNEKILEQRYKNAIFAINHLKEIIENARKALAKPLSWPGYFDVRDIESARSAYDRIERMGKGTPELLSEKEELLAEAVRVRALVIQAQAEYEKNQRVLKEQQKELEREAREKEKAQKYQERKESGRQRAYVRIEDKKRNAEIAAFVEAQREHEELLKAKKEERKRATATKKRQEAKAEKERIKIIQANMPKWVKSVEAAQKFIEENDSLSYLALLSKDDLRRVVMVANALLEAMIPLRDARSEKVIGSNHADLLRAYNIAHDKLLKIIEICSGLISRKSVSNRKRTIEKQKSNKREDSSYFRKMYRLYDDRINASDKWYENESRRFNINRHEDVREYLDAYGRTIRNSLLKAEIVVEGREDVDEWGYFILGDKYLPYCLREVKVVYDNIEYHLYTFNAMTSMDDYDYDGMITDRIFYLRDRGIKTS